MDEALPGEKPEDVMRRKCRAMVKDAKAQGWSGPPFCPHIFASLRGIKVEETDVAFEGDGRIFPRRGDLVIEYRTGRIPERQRFTIFHELAHTCFPDAFEVVRRHDPLLEEENAHRRFENLCDIGASELMMPIEDFGPDLTASTACMHHAQSLQRRYVASIDATLKRLLELTEHSCGAAFLTDIAFKEFAAVRGRMRVRYFWKSENFKGFLHQGTLAPAGSRVHLPVDQAEPFTTACRETWWIKNRPYSWYVEPVRLPVIPDSQNYPKVVALVHSRKPT